MICCFSWELVCRRRSVSFGMLIFASMVLSFGSACKGENVNQDISECRAYIERSVAVHVEDENGATLHNATVEYRPFVLDERFRDCEGEGQFGTATGVYEFTCGNEVSGVIELRASTADGKSGEAEVTVVRGECHVRTENVTIVVN